MNLKGKNKNLSLKRIKFKCIMIEKGFFRSDPILNIATIFNRFVNYVITQVHATSSEKQDKNDQGSNWGKMCFVGPPLTVLASPTTLNPSDNPDTSWLIQPTIPHRYAHFHFHIAKQKKKIISSIHVIFNLLISLAILENNNLFHSKDCNLLYFLTFWIHQSKPRFLQIK